MNRYTHLQIPDMDLWSSDQVLAVYDVCQTISAVLMDKHRDALLKKMADNHTKRCLTEQPCTTSEQNLPLPFDDPF